MATRRAPARPSLRRAIVDWIARRFGVTVEASQVAACVGTKEFVGTLAAVVAAAPPDRDTVLYPEVAYPTYEMGAILAGCRPVAVPLTPDGRLTSTPSPSRRRRALALWVNSPGNPTGACDDLGAVAAWGRATTCRCSPTSATSSSPGHGPPRSILATRHRRGRRRALAVEAVQPGRCSRRLLRRRRRPRRLPAAGPQARRDDGARTRPGGGGRRPRRRRSRRRAARALPTTPRADGRDPRELARSRRACRRGRSTCGSTSATAGRSPSAWPVRAGRSSAPVSSTERSATDSSASPSSNRTNASSSWRERLGVWRVTERRYSRRSTATTLP